MKLLKSFFILSLALSTTHSAGCFAEDASDPPSVKIVKKGELGICKGHSLESLVDGFLGDPSWKLGSSTEKSDTVHLSGEIKVDGKKEPATLIFEVKKGSSSFELSGFELNGTQESLILGNILLRKMCRR